MLDGRILGIDIACVSHGASPTKAILYALAANGGIALCKGAAALYTGSGSMIAESIHSFADCGNQILLLLGLKKSRSEGDKEYPLGTGKAIYFWSFLVAILLFSLGGLFSIYEGIHKLQANEELHQPWIALIVLGVSIILEAFSLFGALREIKLIRGNQTLMEWLKNSRNAELIVVLGEDTAAILGLVVAFVFVTLSVLLKNPLYDAVGSLSIGVILLIISIFIAGRVKTLMIGRSAEPAVEDVIRKKIAAHKGVKQIFNLITIQLGHDIMLAAKIQMDDKSQLSDAVKGINALEAELKKEIPSLRWCFIEPDETDS